MINKKMQTAFNGQINAETYSAYLYWSMSAALETQGLHGFAHWMRVQAGEELGHAKKFYSQLIERGGVVTLKAIEAPRTQWSSVTEMFKDVLKHEQEVTGLIHNLMALAHTEKDYAAAIFLQWFVTEQVEEEANAQETLQRLGMAGDSKGALLMLDKEMGKRGSE
jgi:ferritin